MNFDDNWSNPSTDRHINYTNLPPGDYTFSVKSLGSFGEWSDETHLIDFTVTAPIWYYTWFQVLCVVIFIAVIVVYMKYKEIRLKSDALALDHLVQERTNKIHLQKEEIASQNEKLMFQARTLLVQNTELEKNQRDLTNTKLSLEKMVEARTLQIQQANKELIDQNSQLEQFNFITAHNLRSPIARLKGFN